MKRVRLKEQKNSDFTKTVQEKTGLNLSQLATKCRVHKRTFLDWANDRYLMPLSVFQQMCRIGRINFPQVNILPEYWYTKKAGTKGAFARSRKYGNPGTKEGRKKGGRATSEKFSSNPTLAIRRGFIIRKNIECPKQSTRLAELIGIILGDGGVANYQVVVTLEKTNVKYLSYIKKLFEDLFGLSASIGVRKRKNIAFVVVSSKNLVEYLERRHGLKVGDKIRNKVEIPAWIRTKKNFAKACLRGLFDTDGCVYLDTHIINGRKYLNLGMVFTSYSKELLDSVEQALKDLGFSPTRSSRNNLFLRREKEIIEYFTTIGSSNPKHIMKARNFFKARRKAKSPIKA